MTHVEQGKLQAYLDGEVGAAASADIENHLSICAACAAELTQLKSAAQLFAAALRGIDVPAPARQAPAPQVFALPGRARRPAMAFARAAMLILGVAALASATIPGSPVRDWLTNALRGIGILQEPAVKPAAVEQQAAPATAPAPVPEASLSLDPAGGNVLVVIKTSGAIAGVHVKLVDGPKALVRASGAAAGARFRTGPGRIEITGVTGGEVNVDIPKSALGARVEVDGKVIFQNRGQ